MQNIIYCPICGRNIRFQKICSCCGYDPCRDYDVYPTLGKISEGTESVLAKRDTWEKQRLREAMDDLLTTQTPQIQEKEKKKSTKEENTKEASSKEKSAKEAAKTAKPTEKAARQTKKKTKQASKEDKQGKQKHAQKRTSEKKAETEPETERKKPNIFLAILIIGAIVLALDAINQETRSFKVGDTFTFGAYEQDNITSNGKEEIDWIILDKDKKSLLLVSKYALDCQPYNETRTDVTWETCTLRKWLNSTFFNTAFFDEEQEMIRTVSVSAENTPYYPIDQGNSTEDQIFLLSFQEAEKYFSTDEKRQCIPTAYSVEQGALTSEDYKHDGKETVEWVLRTVGGSSTRAACVDYDGLANWFGSTVDTDYVCVRPALWVDLESGIR